MVTLLCAAGYVAAVTTGIATTTSATTNAAGCYPCASVITGIASCSVPAVAATATVASVYFLTYTTVCSTGYALTTSATTANTASS